MKRILIANKDGAEGQRLIEIMRQQFDAAVICSPAELAGDLQNVSFVLLDSNFTESHGTDFLVEILKKASLPVLMVIPPDDPKCAAEALKLGAFNYIIKTDQYYDIVGILIKEAIQKFEQYEGMKQTIADLKKKVSELEQQVAASRDTQSKPRRSSFNDLISQLKEGQINLPSPPKIQIQFEEMIKNQKGLQEIAQLLKQDVSIASQLISVSNSAYYRGMAENTTVEQAITRLGLNTTKQYVGIICNRSLYATQKKKNMQSIEKLWKHSLGCGLAAQFTCEVIRQKQAEEVFMMGLIHDIGKLILLQIMGELDIDIADEELPEDDRAELLDALSKNHGTFGATLLKRWGFSSLHQQIALFHDDLENADPISRELLIVHFANLVAKSIGYSVQQESGVEVEKALSTNLLKLDSEKITEIREKVKTYMSNLQSIF
jgi:HD-like signal output (HDOD) protein/AmiR/NasT family two-component response regulator